MMKVVIFVFVVNIQFIGYWFIGKMVVFINIDDDLKVLLY